MQTTQLACPHCGSTLTFGREIVNGDPVECLICMRAFAAADVVSVPTPAPAPAIAACSIDSATVATLSDGMASDQATQDMPKPAAAGVEANRCPPPPTESITNNGHVPVAVIEAPTAVTEPAASNKRASKGDILVAKPHVPPPGAVTAKPAPTATVATPTVDKASPAAPRRSNSDDAALAIKVIAVAATCLVLLALTGGIVFAAWKITRAGRTAPPGNDPELADAKKANSGNTNDVKTAGDADESGNYQTPGPKEKQPPPLSPEEEDELRARIQDEVKLSLKRKPSASGPAESDPIEILSIGKQAPVGLDQQKINDAIEKGVAYLKRTQNKDGTWEQGHGVGYAAIGGLTLLECGVPAKDPAVQKAAAYVRFNLGNNNQTYEMSLAILFLDRLGEMRDRPLIQGTALRLLAGQNEGGGWTYNCRPLSPPEMYKLYTFLQSHKQPTLFDPLGGDKKTQSGIAVNPKRDPNTLNDPFHELNELILASGIGGSNSKDPDKKGTSVISSVDPKSKDGPGKTQPKPAVKPNPIPAGTLPVPLQKLPIVKNQDLKKGMISLRNRAGDNSNTQFAMLALWTARRHNVPTDQALLASYQRFMNPQNPDGGWGYTPGAGTTNSMTNVGLLGLAMGHGASPEVVHFDPKNPKAAIVKPALGDPAIQKGLTALSRYIGQPVTDPAKANFPMQNLYFLWSVERVAMLYDLKTIGGKDWYGWGAQILVHNQQAGGEWPSAHYHGTTPPLNTCFALLFLRRSNLVRDLTDNLRLNTGIVDPEK
jgi:hypothetical protein